MTLAAAGGAGSAWQALRRGFLASPLYGLTLMGQRATALKTTPRDPWPGEQKRGEVILREVDSLAEALQRRAEVEPPRQEWLHGFSWLRDLRAVGGDEARRQARELVAIWILEHERWSEIPWRPDIVGTRIAAWLGGFDFFAASADDFFRNELLTSLCRQARHLSRTVRQAPAGSGEVAALHGLIAAGTALPDGERRVAQSLRLLKRVIWDQILDDGGHVERSPRIHLEVLRRLIEMRTLLRATDHEVPPILEDAIERMAPMLRFFRHGDGGLALFNDTGAESGGAIDLVLTQSDSRTRRGSSAPDSGFERLQAGRTVVIADVGAPPPPDLDKHAHAGTLAFEMSVGKERLIVNCGVHGSPTAAWRAVQRSTAAHSTLSVGDTSSSEILPEGGLGRRPASVACSRREEDGSVWIEASHDGYRPLFGVTHKRQLYLGGGGEDFRGADTVAGTAGRKFVLRFHLHPRVKASLIQEGAAVLLGLPAGGGWRFRAVGGRLGLAESVWLGDGGEVKRSEQIVVEGETGPGETVVKWALQAVPKR